MRETDCILYPRSASLPAALSGVDQLKEERLRFVAATGVEPADVKQGNWDQSSESDSSVASLDVSPLHLLRSEDQAPPVPAEAVDAVPFSSCCSHLPAPSTVVAAVRGMLQQHSWVGNVGTVLPQPLCDIQFRKLFAQGISGEGIPQDLQSLLAIANASREVAAAQEYLQQVALAGAG